jgi:hypothetical protein
MLPICPTTNNVSAYTLSVNAGLKIPAFSYDAPRLQAFHRCIPSVEPGEQPPISCIPDAVNDGSDIAIDRLR